MTGNAPVNRFNLRQKGIAFVVAVVCLALLGGLIMGNSNTMTITHHLFAIGMVLTGLHYLLFPRWVERRTLRVLYPELHREVLFSETSGNMIVGAVYLYCGRCMWLQAWDKSDVPWAGALLVVIAGISLWCWFRQAMNPVS